MKATQILLFLIVTAAAAVAGSNGSGWQTLTPNEREMWAAGWLTGMDSAHLVAGNADCIVPFATLAQATNGITADQLAAGITQFYEADYRNIELYLSHVAWFVTQYRAGKWSKAEATARIEDMRSLHLTVERLSRPGAGER